MIESRANTLWRHVHAYIRETSTSWPSFATSVARLHNSTVPEPQRRVHFHVDERGKDPYDAARLDAQILRRMEESGELLADLEEAIVCAMPEDRQDALLQDLCRRYGLLAAPIPLHGCEGTAVSLADFVKRTGKAIEALAPLLDGGKIIGKDEALAEEALDEIDGLIAAATTLRARTKRVAPERVICAERARARRRAS
ncbi:hypothetical protein [Natronospira bacteriovora]|uniref:Uncharacterized protein n=1 Tax=Natronospira bacteriovora TaxID=3069753 RepID=A0ABU0W5Q0_9GAMM|nr:hypothetical protein [Natronospira sp. AB-CW4]MDQ2069287.1 hypothetical protein [Natronospira sp. AB-CW4]